MFAVLKTFAFGPSASAQIKGKKKNTITIAANTLSVESRKAISIEARWGREKRGASATD